MNGFLGKTVGEGLKMGFFFPLVKKPGDTVAAHSLNNCKTPGGAWLFQPVNEYLEDV